MSSIVNQPGAVSGCALICSEKAHPTRFPRVFLRKTASCTVSNNGPPPGQAEVAKNQSVMGLRRRGAFCFGTPGSVATVRAPPSLGDEPLLQLEPAVVRFRRRGKRLAAFGTLRLGDH